MHEISLRESIDACRPGSSDLLSPEFAELARCVATDDQIRHAFEASQQFDAALRESVQDVAAPTGLAARLLSATQSAALEGEEPTAGSVMLPAPAGPSAWSQSYELVAAGIAILACAAAMIAVAWNSSAPPISEVQLVDRAFEWKEQIDHEAWNESVRSAPREEFPTGSRAVFRPWRWQKMSTPNSERVVYYGGPPDVLLFVVRSKTKVQGLSDSPKLLSATGGWSVGAWQSGDLTYVLVVEGDKRKFESHLKTQTPV